MDDSNKMDTVTPNGVTTVREKIVVQDGEVDNKMKSLRRKWIVQKVEFVEGLEESM